MAVLKTTENQLAGLFKGVPNLSDSSRETLAKVWPWVALIFGILQLLAAWSLWRFMDNFNQAADYVNSLSIYLSGDSVALSGTDKAIVYLGLITLVVDAVLLLMAYSPLKARQRRGWDLLFLASLLNVAYAVVALFMRGHGLGSFLFSLLGSAVGFYLLFQVRDKFSKVTA